MVARRALTRPRPRRKDERRGQHQQRHPEMMGGWKDFGSGGKRRRAAAGAAALLLYALGAELPDLELRRVDVRVCAHGEVEPVGAGGVAVRLEVEDVAAGLAERRVEAEAAVGVGVARV